MKAVNTNEVNLMLMIGSSLGALFLWALRMHVDRRRNVESIMDKIGAILIVIGIGLVAFNSDNAAAFLVVGLSFMVWSRVVQSLVDRIFRMPFDRRIRT